MKFFKGIYCTTTLPDDGVERDENYVEIGGEGAARVIGELLTAAGMTVTTPELEEEHCWYFDVKKGEFGYQMKVAQIVDELYVTTKGPSPFWDKLSGRRPDHPAFMDILYDLLSKDDRFRELKWDTRKSQVGSY